MQPDLAAQGQAEVAWGLTPAQREQPQEYETKPGTKRPAGGSVDPVRQWINRVCSNLSQPECMRACVKVPNVSQILFLMNYLKRYIIKRKVFNDEVQVAL